MKKDLKSYEKHNKGYIEDPSYYEKEAIINRTEQYKDFERSGFALALLITSKMPSIHIDIGSGVGWLVRKMSPRFSKSYGIEPSHSAVEAAKKLNEDTPNIHFLEMDMVDGYKKINLESPAFFTTGAVFSHIENYYVAEFLKLLNEAPTDSVLFFSENYDKNIDWEMWHIRSKEWWRGNLSNWQLIFLDIENQGYSSGIYGLKMEKLDLLATNHRSGVWKYFWSTEKLSNIAIRIIKKIKRLTIKTY